MLLPSLVNMMAEMPHGLLDCLAALCGSLQDCQTCEQSPIQIWEFLVHVVSMQKGIFERRNTSAHMQRAEW